MSTQSRSQVIQSQPIGDALDGFRNKFNSICDNIGVPTSSQAFDQVGYEDTQYLLHTLIYALQMLPAARLLHSPNGNQSLYYDLSRLYTAITLNDFNAEQVRPLLDAVLKLQPDEFVWDAVYNAFTKPTPLSQPTLSSQQTRQVINTGSFANSAEYRKHTDIVLKEELGHLYVGIPGFFDAFFGDVPGLRPEAQAVFDKCKEGDSPLFRVESGWRGWPERAQEKDVISWFAPLIDHLLDLTEGHQSESRVRRRLLTQPHQPLQGSIAIRKLDIGFIDDPNAGVNSKCRCLHILIPGELKSNPLEDKASKAWLDLGQYAREVLAAQDDRRFVLGFTLCGSFMRLWIFDRLGGIASKQFNINEDGLQFVSIVLGFLWMSKEQLGFDPTIITVGDKRYIEVERENRKERLVIDRLIKRVPCVAGRATTCWKAYNEEDPDTPLVVKDSWQYPEREEEGELLREATEKQVKNVARYFHHETVCIGGQDDDICANVRKGLDVTKATNYNPEKPMSPPSTTGRQASQRDGSSTTGRQASRRDRSSTAGRQASRRDVSSSVPRWKRSSSCIEMLMPPSKRTSSSSPIKRAIANRVHRRVVVRDYGEAIYNASSQISLLAAFEQCIEGYKSLHTRAGMLQRDISLNNLMVNEDDRNPSWRAFLIDLDLAVKEQRETPSGAWGRTGTRAFMAIGVLSDEQHSYMHDLESFFWVLFWICIHCDGPKYQRVVPRFDKWNYLDMQELAWLKQGIVGVEREFLNTAQTYFTPYYQPLITYVNRLRKKVFPDGERWRVPNAQLYHDMKQIFQVAQNELKEMNRYA